MIILLISVAAAAVFPLSGSASENEDISVRVGFNYEKTCKPSFDLSTDGSFESGYSVGNRFYKLYNINSKNIKVYSGTKKNLWGSELSARFKKSADAADYITTNGGIAVYYNNEYHIWQGLYDNYGDAASYGDAVSTKAMYLIYSGNSAVFIYAADSPLAVRAGNGITKSGDYSYEGYFEFSYRLNDNLSLINVVPLEKYVLGVLPNEIGTNAADEATKALIILTRTIPLKKSKKSHTDKDFDVCITTCCQIYRGLHRQNKRLIDLTLETRGQVLSYMGDFALAIYHTTTGGATCSLIGAWSGTDLPYLRSVDVGEPYENTDKGNWSFEYSMSQLTQKLRSTGGFSGLSGTLENIEIISTDRYGSGYVTELKLTDSGGKTKTIEYSAAIRTALGLYSGNFTISYINAKPKNIITSKDVGELPVGSVLTSRGNQPLESDYSIITSKGIVKNESAVESIIITGSGWGHGVGIGETGAQYLAEELKYDYLQILGTYFPGTEVLDYHTIK